MNTEFNDPTDLTEAVKTKWKPILEHKDCEPITDPYKRNVTAVLLENQEQAMLAETTNVIGGSALGSDGAGAVKTWDPVLISLVRRSMPNLIAYDICGVQPMTGPTGLIFAMKAKFDAQNGTEAWPFNINDNFSAGTTPGTYSANAEDEFLKLNGLSGAQAAGSTVDGYDEGKHGYATSIGEGLGGAANPFAQMAFEISRTSVVAKTRALKAEYTTELAQDLKAIHGLDAETELANILSGQILAEINREVLSSIYRTAKLGCQQSDLASMGTSGGTGGYKSVPGGAYDLTADSDGRWSAEKFRGLLFQIERECNQISKDTRRGKGNIIICSSDVASALAMGGFMNLSGGDAGNLNVDDAGNLLAGTIGGGRIKVYVDPYATFDFVAVGYRGSSAYDAGMFYCPYVPLQMVRAVGEDTFQPKIGFKTRYGLVNNPYVLSGTVDARDLSNVASNRVNQYYRVFRVINLHGTAV